MNKHPHQRLARAARAIGLSGCAEMSPRDRNTTNGAVVGGVIGNSIDPNKK